MNNALTPQNINNIEKVKVLTRASFPDNEPY